jgi:MFS family permease
MSTVAAPVSARAAAWRNAVFVVFATNGLAASAWISRTPSIRDQLELTTTGVGFLIFGVSVGSIIGLIGSSHLVHWLGDRRTIQIFLAGCGLSLLVMGVGATVLGSFPVVLLGFAIFGFSSGICDVAMNVSGAGAEQAAGRNYMPWFHAAWSGGTVVGAGVGSLAAFAQVPVGIHLGIVGVLVIGSALTVIRWIPATHAEPGDEAEVEAKATFRERMSIWLEPRTLLIGLIVLGMAFTEGSANDWLAIGMIDDRGLDNGQGALVFSVFTAAMTVGRLSGVPLLDRFGRVPVLRGAAAAAVIGLAVVILVPIVPIAIVGVVLWGLGASLGFPVGMSAAADDPARAAARVSAVATVGYIAFLVGPPLIGFVGDQIGILNALWIVLGLIVIATLAVPAARETGTAARSAAAVPSSSAQV